MITGFVNLFRVPEIRKKVLITLGLLAAYRVGFHVPIPGVNYAVLERFQETMSGSFAFGIMNALSGGAIGSCMLFTLGVMPYISASIIFSLLVKVVPQLEALAKEGQAGQRIINRYTRYATVPLCIIQALFLVYGLLGQAVGDGVIDRALYDAWYYKAGVVLTMTTGTLIVMWLGEQITEHGVGNGVSLIIMAGIVARLPTMLAQVGTATAGQELGENAWVQPIAELVVLYILITAGIVFVTRAQRRIPIQQGRQMRGRRVYGGQRHYLPLRVNQAGVMPIIFASFLFIVPTVLDKVFGTTFFQSAFRWGGFWYILFYSALVFLFSFFWTSLMFQPKEIADNLKEHGGFVPGLRPGARTAEYLEQVMFRVTLAGGAFLVVIAVLPQFLASYVPNMPIEMAIFLGGTSILIVVGVVLDLVDKVNSMLVMRRYEGLGDSGAGWARRGGGPGAGAGTAGAGAGAGKGAP
ncbi:MAG: preprotein translocase subunit SecY [Planctomycetes bacterium]|nr:preprotein translocase subunit SecY [Planctomycetota bacterium]